MISLVASCPLGARATWKVAALAVVVMIGVCGCEGAGVGVSYEAGGYYAPYDYDYDYGPWGPGYYVGPPVIVGGGFGRHEHDGGRDHDRGGGGGRHFRPAAPSRGVPSIPSRARPR